MRDEEVPSSVLLEHARDKVAVVDDDGTFVYVNEASDRILGYDPEELVGTNCFEYVHPVDRPAIEETFQSVIGTDTTVTETDRYRFRANDGSWVWLESRLSNVTDESLGGYVVSSRDVTDRVGAETRLQKITGTVCNVVWMFDRDWSELLFVNQAYEEVLGQSVERLREDPTSFLEAVHPDDVPCVKAAMERLSEGESVEINYRVNPNTDYSTWVWVQGTPIVVDGEVTQIVGFSRDVTDRKRRERQLAVMDNLLRHNLRNDMDVVLGNAEMIASEADGKAAERAGEIRSVGEQLLFTADKQRKIIDILTSRTAPRPVDVVDVVTDAVRAVRDQYPDARIEVDIPDSARAYALHEIREAVTELVENATRHGSSDSPEVFVGVETSEETVDLTIEDDCPPIPEVEFRVLTGDWEMTDVYHTSGLGLWLVYWVVDLSEGEIAFDRCDESGNAVTITLPRERAGE